MRYTDYRVQQDAATRLAKAFQPATAPEVEPAPTD